MRAIKKIGAYSILLGLLLGSVGGFAEREPSSPTFKTIEWVDLIPAEVLDILLNPPAYIYEIEDGSVEDQISGQIQRSLAAAHDDKYQQALKSTEVNTAMDGAMVRIPGFIVPLEFDDGNSVTEFFLVPYFGACLHMPPPPPNQIIMVHAPAGIELEHLGTPFWVSGKMSTTIMETDLGISAYSMTLRNYEVYEG